MSNLGININMSSIEYQSLAARCRVYLKSEAFPKVHDMIQEAIDSVDAYYVFPYPDWLHHSTIADIVKAYDTIHHLNPPLWYDTTPHLQREVSRFLWQRFIPDDLTTNLINTMSKRLNQFGFDTSSDTLMSRLGICKASFCKVPQFVYFAYVKSCFNALNTSHRYGRQIAPCPWCRIDGGDSLLHLLTCGVMLQAMAQIRPLLRMSWATEVEPPCVPQLCPPALGLDLVCIEQGEDLLLWHDFLHSVYNDRHSHSIHGQRWRQAFAARSRVVNRFSGTNQCTGREAPREGEE